MLMRGQEILSGAQRIHIHDLLVESIRGHEMSPDSDGLRDYVDCFKF
jgi:aspartyl/asparaginyl-tRNA synthetase